jgi:hypothetical protein
MTNLGPPKILRHSIAQTKCDILLRQECVHSLLTEYGMLSTPPTNVPISYSIRVYEETKIQPVNSHQYQSNVGELNYLTKTCWGDWVRYLYL